jgi:DNA-directed RNA polymerase specialized sigma24 family protein
MSGTAFVTTHWSVVLRAGDSQSPLGADALEALCRSYWYPVYGEIRRRGHPESEAQDLTQEFFACLLRRGSIAEASPAKGRFRSYLLGSLAYFLADARNRDRAAKRGGGCEIVSFDGVEADSWYRAEPMAGETPDRAFDRRWLWALLDTGLRQLEAEQTAAGKADQFARLKPYLACETEVGDYRRLAVELGVKTGTLAVAIHRLRQRYREIIRTEVRQTLLDPADLEDELRHLCEG